MKQLSLDLALDRKFFYEVLRGWNTDCLYQWAHLNFHSNSPHHKLCESFQSFYNLAGYDASFQEVRFRDDLWSKI